MPFAITVGLKTDTGVSATDKLTSNATLTGTGAANQVVYVYRASLSASEADRLVGTTLADAAGNWTYLPPLSDGKQNLVIRQSNNLGESAAASFSFVLDQTAPAVVAGLKTAPVASFSTSTFSLTVPGATVTPTINYSNFIDLNKDGFVDWFGLDSTGNTITVALNNAGSFTAVTTLPTGNAPVTDTAADLNGDGFADIVIANGADGTVSIMLGDGTGNFKSTTMAVGPFPGYTRLGDVTGDGKADLLVASPEASTVTLYAGDGAGGLTKQSTIATGIGPVRVLVGDLNGDGKSDMAIANEDDGTVWTYLGNGLGAFTLSTKIDVGSGPVSLQRTDVNRDGKQDLLVANGGDSTVSVLLGNGTGGFTPYSVLRTQTNANSLSVGDLNGDELIDLTSGNSVAIGDGFGNFRVVSTSVGGSIVDVNNDGKLDLLRSGGVSINTTSGNRNGMTSDTTLTGTADPRSVITFFENGVQIGATMTSFGGTWSYRPTLADGKHTIVARQTDATGNVGSSAVAFTVDTIAPTPNAVLFKDNGVSAVDKLTNDPTISGKAEAGDRIAVFEGATQLGTTTAAADGTWSFTPFNLSDGAHSLFVTETDGAGNSANSPLVSFTLDKLAPRVTVSLSPPTSLGMSVATGFNSGITFPSWVALGDVNGDGNVDVVTAQTSQISTLLGNGAGGFAAVGIVSTTGTTNFQSSHNLVDFNGDGKLDIINTVSLNGAFVGQAFLGDGSGKFAAPLTFALPTTSSTVLAADLNGDKKADLVTGGGVYLGNGTGTFTAVPSSGGSLFSTSLLADVTGDGILDAIGTFSSSSSFFSPASAGAVVLPGQGGGKFGFSINVSGLPTTNGAPSKVFAGDVNGDGRMDLVVTGFAGTSYYVATALGLGGNQFTSFGATTPIGTTNPSSAALADVNADGRADFVYALSGNTSVVAMTSDGSGQFLPSVSFNGGTSPNLIAVADLNGDNKVDIVASSNSSVFANGISYSPVNVLLNTTTGPVGNVTKSAVLAGTAEAGSIVSLFEGATLLGSVNPDAAGKWSLAPVLAEGKHVLSVVQSDPAGNKTTAGITVLIKTKASAITAALVQDTGGSAIDFITQNAALKGTGGIGDTITVQEGATTVGTTVVKADGTWTVSPGLTDGAHKLTIIGSDPAGNLSAPLTINLIRDTTAPSLTTIPPSTTPGFQSVGAFNSIAASGASNVIAADFDNDGKTDFLVGDTTQFGIMRSDGTGALARYGSPVSTNVNTALYTSGDVNGDGKIDVIVGAFSPSAQVSVWLNQGGGIFSPTTTTGLNNYLVAAGDLNGDGKADIASVSGNTVSILFSDGSGKFGTPAKYTIGGSASIQPLVIDLNRDGKLDLAVLSTTLVNGFSVGAVAILLNDGSGKFVDGGLLTLPGAASWLASGDLDGDGSVDIVTTGNAGGATTIHTLLGDGKGGFGAASTTTTGSLYTPGAIAVADFSGDGRADLMIGLSQGTASLLVSDGTGRFGAPSASLGTIFGPARILAADLNLDGKMDAVVSSVAGTPDSSGVFTTPLVALANTTTGPFGNTVKTPLIKGSGEVGRAVSIFEGATLLGSVNPDGTGNWSFSPVLADGAHTLVARQTDAAGNTSSSTLKLLVKSKASVVTAGLASDTGLSAIDGITNVAALAGKGGAGGAITIMEGATKVGTATVRVDGTWSAKVSVADGAHSFSVSETDLAGNVSAAVTVAMTLDTAAPVLAVTPYTKMSFAPPSATKTSMSGMATTALTVVDVDGDGKRDVVNFAGGQLVILPGLGTGAFGAERIVNLDTTLQFSTYDRTVLGDVNGDGKVDALSFFGGSTSTMKVQLNDGKGNFGAATTVNNVLSGTIGKLNADAAVDLVTASGNTASVQMNDGKGGFASITQFSLGSGVSVSNAATADLNGDGRDDLIAYNALSSGFGTGLAVAMNDGTGKFAAAAIVESAPIALSQVLTADVNRDGKTDLIGVVRTNNGTDASSVQTYLGDGTGRFSASQTTTLNNQDWGPASIADVNGDGLADLVLSRTNDADVAVDVRLGDGTGAFSVTQTKLGIGLTLRRTVIADLNNDGRPDIVGQQFSTLQQPVQVMMNTTTGPFGYVMAAPTIIGKGEAGMQVTLKEGNTTLGTSGIGALGNWLITPPALSPGLHRLTLSETDKAGNTTSSLLAITVPAPASAAAGITEDATVVFLRGGGTQLLDPTLTNATVMAGSAIDLILNKLRFITAVGSDGNDRISAQGLNQTLTGGAGRDELIGFSGFGTTFRDTAAGLDGDVIRNFGGDDVIALTDLLPGASLAYQGNAVGGTLSLSDGTHTARISLEGNYTASDFRVVSDGHGGSQVLFTRA